jgi:hypothetical protein
MVADNKKPWGVQALLDAEFVPMPVAAAMAYFDITAQRKVVGSAAELVEVGRLVAIALSTVAPIYRVAEDGKRALALTADEINERLFRAKNPTLDDLAIRRDDLDQAIASLKEARASFDLPRGR